jgi:hypothetical protein
LLNYLEDILFPYFVFIFEIQFQTKIGINNNIVFMNGIQPMNDPLDIAQKYSRIFVKNADYSMSKCREARYYANLLSSITPALDRDGKGALYDSFTETTRTYRFEADGHYNDYQFFISQAQSMNFFIYSVIG